MRQISLALAVIAFAVVSTAHAAVSYNVTISRGSLPALDGTFAVAAAHGKISARATGRPEHEPVIYDGLLSADGSTIIALNSTNATWYTLEQATPFAVSSLYLNPLPKASVKNLKMQFEERDAGDGQRHYAVRVTYEVRSNFHGAAVVVFCSASFEVTTTTRFERRHWLGRVLPVTGLEAVDAKLAEADATIAGLPLRASLSAGRRYEGGPEMKDEATVDTRDLGEVKSAGPAVRVPEGYREQKPVVSGPGR